MSPIKNNIATKITIGVKSIGPIDVGNIFLTDEYKGSIIEDKNFGLHLIHTSCNHDRITSANTKYCMISKKI